MQLLDIRADLSASLSRIAARKALILNKVTDRRQLGCKEIREFLIVVFFSCIQF